MATNKENKIKYGIKNVYYAKVTETVDETGAKKYTYDAPKPLPGAKSVSLDAEGETTKFYADNVAYYLSTTNNGYSGDLEVAYITQDFREDILNEKVDSKGVLVENSEAGTNAFALLFQFEGDVKAVKRVLYNCTATRPGIASETTEETKEPGTESVSLEITPREDGLVKSQTGPDTDDETYSNWNKKVYEPTFTAV